MTFATIQHMLAGILGLSADLISPNFLLNPENGVATIDLAKLIIRCEKHFSIAIRDEDAADFCRLSDIAEYVDAQIEDGRKDYKAPREESSREAWFYQ